MSSIDPKHYTELKISPLEYIQANKISWNEGNIIKYVSRYKMKNGIEDLKKAEWYLKNLIKIQEVEKAKRLKPLLGKFGFNTLLVECKGEGWEIPSYKDIEGKRIGHSSCWVSDLPTDKADHETHALRYIAETGKLVLFNKNFIECCVVLADEK